MVMENTLAHYDTSIIAVKVFISRTQGMAVLLPNSLAYGSRIKLTQD